MHESGLALFNRSSAQRRRKRPRPQSYSSSVRAPSSIGTTKGKPKFWDNLVPGPMDGWMLYCYLLTCCIPSMLLNTCGLRSPEQQRAWREKMGLLAVIASLMASVGFITFGFTQTVCGTVPQSYHTGTIDVASLIIHGYDYDFSHFKHPVAPPYFNGTQNPLYVEPWMAQSMDASFLFQTVNQNCKGIITLATGSAINSTGSGTEADLAWYFPCNLYNQYGTTPVNKTGYDTGTLCHTTSAQQQFSTTMQPQGQVYYTWDDIQNQTRNLAVYESFVFDLDLLQWLDRSQVNYPTFFDDVKNKNGSFNGRDITMFIYRSNLRQEAACLQDTVLVGFIDSQTVGCIASKIVLIVSLVFIIGVVAIKFCMAVIFGWFLSWRIGSFHDESYDQRRKRAEEIEQWTDDIYRPAPARYRPNAYPGGKGGNRKSTFLPSISRFSRADGLKSPPSGSRPATMHLSSETKNNSRTPSTYAGFGSSVGRKLSHTTTTPEPSSIYAANPRYSLPFNDLLGESHSGSDPTVSVCPFPLHNVIQQPPSNYEPYNFPLLHTICLVTAYSESLEGLRTTLDSLATTDYPNSHKLLMVIADGTVYGAGNALSTPEIVLSMMGELVVPKEEVEPHSYVAIADGHKRHNMAKVYAGFYEYDDNTVEKSKQQRVPIVLVHKCGNPLEVHDPKPGNRGKRDSQIVLMGFLQKVMFDERMTMFEYEFFNSIWRVTGITADRYETVLCVDADTKVFPDSLTRMVSCMVYDEEIMGLCGETKIANKGETWVTMIQVFEYYISHHLTKAFESMFGGVTCLPGCFSMYRIKAPKEDTGFWVPILANPDIVEHYSENIVDTLHKKNLLLLGEDRYLTTLMLKTFPKRKLIFCPQAVCKTIVPDSFRVLLSQRRRWINSTVHNLAELLFVRDLCGTFCFSMQFVVFMELAGTLVLPAAISFTIYLIVISLIPSEPTPTMSLILLGIILGLPGVLIVVTSRKVAYVGWMLVYLLSLPIWNLVLPAYAFWHFDDFSWGQTRMVTGELKDGNFGDKEGEFDSSHIVMKRWAEFERERRWRNEPYPRMSEDSESQAPWRPESNRISIDSVSDTYASDNADGLLSRQSRLNSNASVVDSDLASRIQLYTAGSLRVNGPPVLTLPAPLSVPSRRTALDSFSSSNSSTGASRDIAVDANLQRSPEPMATYLSPTSSGRSPNRAGSGSDQQTRFPVAHQASESRPLNYSRPLSAANEITAFAPDDMGDEVGQLRWPPPQVRGRDRGGHRMETRAAMSTESQRRPTAQASTAQSLSSPEYDDECRDSRVFPSSFSTGGLPPGAAPPQPQRYSHHEL